MAESSTGTAREGAPQTDEHYRTIVEDIPALVCTFREGGTILYVNDAYGRYFNRTRDELVGSSFMMLIPEKDREYVKAAFGALTAENPVAVYDHRVIAPDGAIRHQRWTDRAVFDEQGRLKYYQSIGEDVTERKEAEERLKTYELMVQSAHDAVFFKDLESRYVLANPKTLEVFGRPAEEVLGKNDLELTGGSPEARANVDDDRKVFESGAPLQITKRMTDPGGKEYWFQAIKVPQFDENGAVRGLVGIARDVTEQKHAEDRVLRYQEQLRKLAARLSSTEERERRSLAADLHDHIGQSLAVAKMRLSGLRRAGLAADAAGQIDEVYRLVDEMVQATRSLTFQLSPALLYEVGFEAAAEWLAEQIGERHGIAVQLTASQGAGPIPEEPASLLYRGLRELLMNVVRHAEAEKAKVTIGQEAGSVSLTVEDNGRGFDFDQVVSRAGDAGGFGLFSIRERLSSAGGRLEVESRPGKGARVTISVPLARSDAKANR